MNDRVAAGRHDGERRLLTFRVDGRLYAFPAEDVSEIIHIPPVARLPHSPKCLMGLANLRGTVLPVVDLRAMLGLAPFAMTATARGIVSIGITPCVLAVDAVEALTSVATGQIETRLAEPATEAGERLLGAFQAGGPLGVAKILDLHSLLADAFKERSRPEKTPLASGALAAATPSVATAEDRRLLVSFAVAGQDYALALESVREIVPFPDSISVVPRAEAVLLGVTSYRDTLLPLLSLRGLLGFAVNSESDGREKVIVTPVGDRLVGLVADQMRAIIRADARQIDTAPPMLAARTGGEARITSIYRGDGGRHLVSVLATDQLFREDVMRRLGDPSAPASPQQAAAEQSMGEMIQVVVFRLGEEEFGLPVGAVDEVARVSDQITRVPKTPKFLEGVINLRGEVLPIVDQRRRFDMPKSDGGDRRRLIVVRTERHRAGLIVDGVSEVLRWPEDAIEPAPDLAQEGARLINGVINVGTPARMILLLDPAELLTRAERGILDRLDLAAGDNTDAPARSGS